MGIPAGFVGNSSGYYTRAADAAGPFSFDGTNMLFVGAIANISISSGNVANATASATIGPSAGKTSFLTGFEVTGAGSTAGAVVPVTITGALGGTITYVLVVPAGVTTSITPLIVNFPNPIPSSAANVALVVSAAAFGAGNTNAAVVAHGYVF